MLLAVELAGTTYIADVGFGGMTLTAPLKLRADIEQATPHETFRLTGGEPDWQLEAKIGEDWQPLYVFNLAERQPEDYEAANQYTSSDPQSKFTRDLSVALSPPGRRLGLAGNRLTTHVTGEPPQRQYFSTVEELRSVLSDVFGIGLPPANLLDPALQRVLDAAPPRAD
jgi:N-hydroxyarylamine O-acetyltransferase